MRIKRVLQGTALTALAAAAWMGTGVADASAADATNTFPVDKLSFEVKEGDKVLHENDGQTLYVTAPDDAQEVIFGVGTYNANKKTVKIASWDVHDVKKDKEVIEIDLSKLSNVKDNYIAVRTESTNPVYIRIAGSIKSQKTKYAADTGILTVSDLKTGSKAVTEAKATNGWEYRTPYGSWEELDLDENNKSEADAFASYQDQGASIYLRAAADLKIGAKLPDKIKDANDKAQNPTEYPLYDGGKLAGKEKKFSIPKKANGPKVTVDYAKGTVKIPDKTEYRVFAASGSAFELITPANTDGDKIAKNSDKNAKDVIDFLTVGKDVASAGVLEVRKEAVSGKKAVSKWTRVELAAPKAFTAMDNIKADANITTATATSGKVTINYVKDKKEKFSTKNSIIITNGSSDNIDVIVAGSEPKATDKAKTIKSTKNATIKVSNGNTVYIRTAGDKKTTKWAGAYTAVGKIAIPADPTPAASATPAQ